MMLFRKGSLMLLATALILSMNAEAKETRGVTKDEVKVGGLSILSGPFAFFGTLNEVMQAYFKKINEEEGGIHGRKINYVLADSANAANKAVELVKKMVDQEKVFAMLTSLGELNLATYKYLESKKVLDVFPSDQMSIFTDQFAKTRFCLGPSWTLEAQSLSDYIAKNFAGKKMGIMYVNAIHGKESLKAIKESLKGKVVFGPEEAVEYDAVTADAQVLNMKKAKVDFIYIHHDPPLTPAAVKFANQNNFKPTWITSSYNLVDEFIELAGKQAAEGVISTGFYHAPSENVPGIIEHKKLLKKYLPKVQASGVTIFGQANAEAFVEVLRRAGPDLTQESFIKAAESFKDWKCSVCTVAANSGPKDHRLIKSTTHFIVKNGQWVPLDPVVKTAGN